MPQNPHSITAGQRRGLEKLGDIYAPGDSEFPSFSQLGCAACVDEILSALPDHDRRSLVRLLSVCRYAPRWLLGLLVRLAEAGPRIPGPPGNALRLLRLGLRSVVYTLYYSGRVGPSYAGLSPLQIIGYDVSVYTGDLNTER